MAETKALDLFAAVRESAVDKGATLPLAEALWCVAGKEWHGDVPTEELMAIMDSPGQAMRSVAECAIECSEVGRLEKVRKISRCMYALVAAVDALKGEGSHSLQANYDEFVGEWTAPDRVDACQRLLSEELVCLYFEMDYSWTMNNYMRLADAFGCCDHLVVVTRGGE